MHFTSRYTLIHQFVFEETWLHEQKLVLKILRREVKVRLRGTPDP